MFPVTGSELRLGTGGEANSADYRSISENRRMLYCGVAWFILTLRPRKILSRKNHPGRSPSRHPGAQQWHGNPPPPESARGLAHSKTLRVRRAFRSARQRLGLRWPSTAFSTVYF
jgi:hypothetical protein